MPSRDFKRTDRVGAELRRELGLLVHAAVRDHGLPSVSVSDVEVTRDLDWATVWVTALMPEQVRRGGEGAEGDGHEFRHALSHSGMRLRRVPELSSSTTTRSTRASASRSLLRQARRATCSRADDGKQRLSRRMDVAEPMKRPPRISFRDLHGIVLLDKPLGLSSNQALQAVRASVARGQGRPYRRAGSAGHRFAAAVLWRSDQARRHACWARARPIWPSAGLASPPTTADREGEIVLEQRRYLH